VFPRTTDAARSHLIGLANRVVVYAELPGEGADTRERVRRVPVFPSQSGTQSAPRSVDGEDIALLADPDITVVTLRVSGVL